MLTFQFVLINVNFVVNLLAALVLFAIFWLHFDAWLNQRTLRAALPFLGFLLLSVSFVVASVMIEQSLLENSVLGGQNLTTLQATLRILGYVVLILGQLITPLQPLPSYRNKTSGITIPLVGFTIPETSFFSFPALAAGAGLVYLRRATTGLEHHLKPIALAFFILSISELLNLALFFRPSDNIALSNLVSAFGPVWIAQRLVLVLAIYVFGRWAWGYLLKRFESQLFIIFTTVTLTIFLLTAISFTFATLDNVKKDILATLKTDVGVLSYTIDSKKSEVLADAETLSFDPRIPQALLDNDRETLSDITIPVLLTKKASELVILSKTGEIILRAEDLDSRGGSLSADSLVKSALEGNKKVSVVAKEGAISPIISIRAAAPISGGGVVLMGSDIDSAFVDGVKKATGLDASVYADNVRAATTFVSLDGKSRYSGIKETSENVKSIVLKNKEIYSGSINILNVPYFSAFAPLNNSDNNPIGMLFVGRPEVSILETAGRSIEITFITTALLLVLSTIASYFVSKYIVSQIR